MFCTKCQEVIRPVVALDIDGTMGRYHEHFLKFAEAYLDKEVPWDFDSSTSFRHWFKQRFGASDDTWHDIKLAYRQGGMKRSMPAYPYASNLSKFILEQGAELWVTTTRPYIRHDNVDPDTREWLKRNGIRYHYLLYDGDKYQRLIHMVGAERIALIIDDLVEELQSAFQQGIDPNVLLLRRNAFNAETSWSNIVGNLSDATHFVKDRLEQWKERHDRRDA